MIGVGVCDGAGVELDRHPECVVSKNAAVALAFERYNADIAFRTCLVETGNVLWRRRDGVEVFLGDLVLGPDASSVAIYAELDARIAVIESVLEVKGPHYLGDIHTHCRNASAWLGHFPSPEDFTECSALCDLWASTEVDLPIAPSIQLIQSMLFGDVFVAVPTLGRTTLRDAQEQEACLTRIYEVYSKWHFDAHCRHGGVPSVPTHDEFIAIVRAELADMNACVGTRVTVEFVVNTEYVDAPPPAPRP